jgi:hypothetical protein
MNTETYLDRLRDAAIAGGFTWASYGRIGGSVLPVLRRVQADDAPEVYLSAGVHGDEPAGPMAVLDLLRQRRFPASLNYTLFPLVNPEGLAAGTRENGAGIDLNRDYGPRPRSKETRAQLAWIGDRCFDLVLCLHEDSDGRGFYLYAHQRIASPHDYAGLALDAARPITGIDGRTEIDGMPAREGRMHPPESALRDFGDNLPEALRLHLHHAASFTFTTETPSRQPIVDRIRAQSAVVKSLLETFAAEWPLSPRGTAP